ncbi:MAG: ribonuclease D [Agitococcus sp.]
MNWQLITEQQRFNELLPIWASAKTLALDTEFMRVNTFNPQIALIQLKHQNTIYLIDPTACDTVAWGLGEVLANPNCLKIVHACSEDIEVLFHTYPNAKINHIFDTQIALAFLGYGLQVGYQKALKDLLDIDISKAETRSDWLARPLSEEQLQYAASDVEYLPALYDVVFSDLSNKGLLKYCQEDSALMLTEGAKETEMESLYRQFSLGWQLNRQQLSLLHTLSMWRDGSARLNNIPRTFVLKNHTLMAIVQQMPQTLAQLARIEDLHPKTYQKHGSLLLEMIRVAQHKPDAKCPPPLPLPLPKAAKSLFTLLKQQSETIALQYGIPPDVLLRKRWLDALVLNYIDEGEQCQLPLALQGWRYDLLTQPLLHTLSKQGTQLAEWRSYRHRLSH